MADWRLGNMGTVHLDHRYFRCKLGHALVNMTIVGATLFYARPIRTMGAANNGQGGMLSRCFC